MRNTTRTRVGEIVEVEGGHIVLSTGRKDRHSKVCTAKGPRDRRVRLSAHTAIQFYDVQDRLGYDRPSKAVDWLINKAKAAIDQLDKLPAWIPTTITNHQQINEILHREPPVVEDGIIGCGGGRMLQEFQQQENFAQENNNSIKYNSVVGSGFLSVSMDTDIVDTVKSFLPIVSASETTASFLSYSTTIAAANHNHQQDLRLSLQSFQDPILLHNHHQQQQQIQRMLFTGTNTSGFDSGGSSGWLEQHHGEEQEHDYAWFHRMVAWNAAVSDSGNNGHDGGFVFNSSSPSTVAPASMIGHNGQNFTQRGPLQSSYTPSIRAWIDPNSFAAAATAATASHSHYHYLSPAMHQASVYGGIGFASPSGGFSGYQIPARIQGEEEHDGILDKPSSASSDSRH